MNILVLGGTRFFGKVTVQKLIENGHSVTIATRGKSIDNFGESVSRIVVDRYSFESMSQVFKGLKFDLVIDKIAYSSNDVKIALDTIKCNKYMLMSSTAVYQLKNDTRECEFNPLEKELVWCNRADFSYDEVKRQSEIALVKSYDIPYISVRYPIVLGTHDYTKRLYFYIENIIKGNPMYIDNLNSQLGFISEIDAGNFMAYLVDTNFTGAVNGSSIGSISIQDIISYVENNTGLKAILSNSGLVAPFNGIQSYSINVEVAKSLGYEFSNINSWIYPLIDFYIHDAIERKLKNYE